jgi:hypothetical protein
VPTTVTLTLAHPLNAKQADRLHAKDSKDYAVGDKIVVPPDDARAIINAGFAQGVDPEDHEQVKAALTSSTATSASKPAKSSS